MAKVFVFVDNGPTGSIGVIREDGTSPEYIPVPTYKERNHTKGKSRHTTHVDYDALVGILRRVSKSGEIVLASERPLINPGRFFATISGVRAHEVFLCAARSLKLSPACTYDSRNWQPEALGPFSVGESKERSRQIGTQLFPQFAELIAKRGEADGILGAWIMAKRFSEGRDLLTGKLSTNRVGL